MEEKFEDKIDLTRWFDQFYKNIVRCKKIILLLLVICTLFSVGKTVFQFNMTYSSSAVFVANNSQSSNMYTTNDDNDEFLSTFSSLLKSEMMNKIIMQSLNVNYVPGTTSVSRVTNTNLIELRVTSSDPQMAYDMINCILNNYYQVSDMVMNDVSIILLDTPVLAENPDATPNYIKSGIKGMGMGLGLSFALVLFLSVIRKTINTNDDVKNILHLSNLTKVPYVTNSTHSSLLVSNPGIQYQIKHAFKELRLKLEQEQKKNQSKVFMVTSTMPNEGKSTISANIAITLAEKGHHVVLVDTDLRNPSIMRIIKDQEKHLSITDYLKGQAKIQDILNQYMDYPLHVIFGNEFINDAPEMLSKPNFENLIQLLKNNYDYVILDVPPLYTMEDAILVAKHCDSALITIKQDHTNSYDILESLEELNEHTPILGTVLNQVKPSIFDVEQSSYGYGYGYGYGRK